MRIEINAGGLSGMIAIAEYQSNMAGFISNTESVIESFKAVRSETYSLSGGVGNLQGALDNIDARISQEETKKNAAVQVHKKSNDFLDLAIRVDKDVAKLVDKNRDQFYRVHPWLKPASISEEEKPWYKKAWDWLCGAGETIKEGAKQAWNWVKDTAKKAWDGLVEFYNEHKKLIDTIVVVIGAVVTVVAIVASGGLALAPLLMALGCSAGVAAAISGAVAVVALVTTVASSSLNVIDIWCEIDNPTFNAWQKGLGWASTISGGIYKIGNLYNKLHGITNLDLKNFAKYLNTDARYGFGSHGQVVEYLSDYYPGSDSGIQHGMGTREFYSIDNGSGGRIYVSTDPISQPDFASIVDNATGKVNILTGTHGDIDGLFLPEYSFYQEDLARWASFPNVSVLDVTTLSKIDLSNILNSNSINICAWCFSERSKAILSALNLIH